MVAHQATVDAADFWHVALAPGETKVLTLEQLDDLFRLDIIDAATRVWQPGMSEWLPLSVVAGIEAEPVTKPKAAAPAPPSSRAPARPPSPPQRPAPVATASFGAAPARPAPVATASFGAAPARPVSFQPSLPTQPVSAAPLAAPWPGTAAPSQRPNPAAQGQWPSQAAASQWPNQAAATQSARPTPESFRPIVVTHRPMPAPSGGGTGGRVVLALALIAGLGVTLYRNDVLRQAAVSAGKEAAYLKVEAALGGPGFGTPRAVALAAPASLNAAVAAAEQTSSPRSTQASSASNPPPANEPARAAESEKSATNGANPVSLSSLVATQLSASKSKAERAAPPRPAARPASGAAAPARGLGIKGSSNALDPLNGKL